MLGLKPFTGVEKDNMEFLDDVNSNLYRANACSLTIELNCKKASIDFLLLWANAAEQKSLAGSKFDLRQSKVEPLFRLLRSE